MKILILLLLLYITPSAWAQKGVLLHLQSTHPNSQRDLNNDTPGIGVALGDGKIFTALGGFKNSNEDTSFYLFAGARKRFFVRNVAIEPGLLMGPLTGYGGTLYAVIPTLSVGKGDFRVSVSYAHKNYGADSAYTLHLEKWFK